MHRRHADHVRPVASDPALTVSEVTGGAFTVTGELAPGQVVTVDEPVR